MPRAFKQLSMTLIDKKEEGRINKEIAKLSRQLDKKISVSNYLRLKCGLEPVLHGSEPKKQNL